MRSPEEVKKLVSELNIEPRPELRDEVLGNALALQKAKPQKTSGNRIWKMIMEKPIRLLPPALAALIMITLFIGLNKNGISPDGATTAWADVIRSLNAGENISVVITQVIGDDDPLVEKMWFRLPDHYRYDEGNSTEIDNGIDFLRVNHEKKSYRYSPSNDTFEPIIQNDFIRFLGLFNGDGKDEEVEGLTAVHNPEKSTDEKKIFDLSYSFEYTEGTRKKSTGSGFAIVDPSMMRPLNIKMEIINGEGQNVSVNIDANYDPITEEIFYPEFLKDYRELEREKAGAITGKVIDAEGKPVEGATVEAIEYYGPALLRGPKKSITDKYGRFFYTLPPITISDSGKHATLPVLLRAYKEGFNQVGWAVLSTSKDIESPVEVSKASGAVHLLNARDVVLKMEQAGCVSGTIVDVNGRSIPDVDIDVSVVLLDESGKPVRVGDSYRFYNWHLCKQIDYETYDRFCKIQTDSNGRFKVLHIPQFRNKVEIRVFSNKDGYLKDFKSIKEGLSFDSRDIDVKLYKKEIKISGTLENQAGKKLGGRFVNLVIDGKRYRNVSHTDAKGRFNVEAPAVEDIIVEVELSESWFYGIGSEYDKNKYENTSAKIEYKPGKTKYKVELVAGKLLEKRK